MLSTYNMTFPAINIVFGSNDNMKTQIFNAFHRDNMTSMYSAKLNNLGTTRDTSTGELHLTRGLRSKDGA
jgi:hypothetical protein